MNFNFVQFVDSQLEELSEMSSLPALVRAKIAAIRAVVTYEATGGSQARTVVRESRGRRTLARMASDEAQGDRLGGQDPDEDEETEDQ